MLTSLDDSVLIPIAPCVAVPDTLGILSSLTHLCVINITSPTSKFRTSLSSLKSHALLTHWHHNPAATALFLFYLSLQRREEQLNQSCYADPTKASRLKRNDSNSLCSK